MSIQPTEPFASGDVPLPTAPALSLGGLAKRFGAKIAVDGISLDVRQRAATAPAGVAGNNQPWRRPGPWAGALVAGIRLGRKRLDARGPELLAQLVVNR